MKKIYLDLGITAYHFFQERMREQFGFNAHEFKKGDLLEFLNNFCNYLQSNNYEVYVKTDKYNSPDVACKDIAEKIISQYTETDAQETSTGIGRKGVVYYYYFSRDTIKELSEKYDNMDKDYFNVICDYEADKTRKDYESKVRNKYYKSLYEMNFLYFKSEEVEKEKEEEEKFENENIALA